MELSSVFLNEVEFLYSILTHLTHCQSLFISQISPAYCSLMVWLTMKFYSLVSEQTWDRAGNETKDSIQHVFQCCSFDSFSKNQTPSCEMVCFFLRSICEISETFDIYFWILCEFVRVCFCRFLAAVQRGSPATTAARHLATASARRAERRSCRTSATRTASAAAWGSSSPSPRYRCTFHASPFSPQLFDSVSFFAWNCT